MGYPTGNALGCQVGDPPWGTLGPCRGHGIRHADPPPLAVREGGVYHVQWRGVDLTAAMPGENEEWRDPKRVVSRGSIISKKSLLPTKRYQVRVPKRQLQAKRFDPHRKHV